MGRMAARLTSRFRSSSRGSRAAARSALCALALVFGCEAPQSPPAASLDAAAESGASPSRDGDVDGADIAPPHDAADAPMVRPKRDGSVGGCEQGAHVDCFWDTPTCEDGVVIIPIHAPIPYCTNEEASAAYWRGVCRERARRRPCPSGRCAVLNPRFEACVARYDPFFAMVDALCEGTVRGEGETCTGSNQCFLPGIDPEAALRCDADAGRCVRAQRGADAATPGTGCTGDADCARGTVCAQHRDCQWHCTAVADGGLAYDAAAPDGA